MGFKFGIDLSGALSSVIGGLMKKGATNLAGQVSKMMIEKGSEVALEFVQDKLGVEIAHDKTDEEIFKQLDSKKVSNTITSLDLEFAKIAKEQEVAELEAEQRNRELELEAFKEELIDVKDARDRDEQQRLSGGNFFERNVTHIFAFIVTIMIFALIAAMIFGIIPKDNQKYADILLGVLGTWEASIISHYFGHSKSSGDKTKLLAAQQK